MCKRKNKTVEQPLQWKYLIELYVSFVPHSLHLLNIIKENGSTYLCLVF